MQKDSTLKTLTVAGILCVVCSILVSSAAVLLRPVQEENKKLDIKKKLLLTAGLINNPKASKSEVAKAFKSVETKVIDLASGKVATDMNPENFDQKKADKDPKLNKRIVGYKDIAKIKVRSRYSKVYFVKKNGVLDQIVLPVHGKGLWSTMYGFLSLAPDTKTVKGFGFYEHGETPGLGGEVDNPNWKNKWVGKVVYDNTFKPIIDVIKGAVDTSRAGAEHQIDGLSGATMTSVGVENLINYWLGDDGFGPYLAKIRGGAL